VVVIPSQVGEEVAHDAYEQERLEEFIQNKIAQGASILGVYPPDEQTKAEYAEWRKQQG
jgi:regulator of RNase E activity RraA